MMFPQRISVVLSQRGLSFSIFAHLAGLPWRRTLSGFRSSLIVGSATVLFGVAGLSLGAQTAYFSGSVSTLNSTGLAAPYGAAFDSHGNLYVADPSNDGVYILSAAAGGTYSAPVPVPTATAFIHPTGIAVDAGGNIYLADSGNYPVAGQVWEIPAASTATTPAIALGSGWEEPAGVLLDSTQQYLFVSDAAAGTVTRIRLSDSSATVNPNVGEPTGLALDANGNLYAVSESSQTIVTVPGALAAGFAAATPAQVGTKTFTYALGLSMDAFGNLWVAEAGNPPTYNGAVWEMLASTDYNAVETWGYGFHSPIDAVPDGKGNIVVTDTNDAEVKEIAIGAIGFGSAATASTSASSPITLQFTFNGAGPTVIAAPRILTLGAVGQDFADAGSGTCTTTNGATNPYTSGSSCTVTVNFAPTATGTRYGAVQLVDDSGAVLASTDIYGNGTGSQLIYVAPLSDVESVLSSGFTDPAGLAVDANGNVFVADSGAGVIDRISGASSTPIGGGFAAPLGVAVDGAGNVFVADTGNHTVDEIAFNGTNWAAARPLTNLTLGGSAFNFSSPAGLAVDASGNLFVADKGTRAVYEVLAASNDTVVQQLGGSFTFSSPGAVAVDGSGNLYVADSGLGAIYEFTNASGYAAPGAALVSGLASPTGIAVDGAGNVFFTNGASVEELPGGGSAFVLAALTSPYGIAVDGNRNVYTDPASTGNPVVMLKYSGPTTLNFASTQFGETSSDSPQAVIVQNVGAGPNSAVSLSGSPIVSTSTAGAGNSFALDSSTSCSASTVLMAESGGSTCTVAINFVPQTTGSIAGSATITDSAPSSPQSISLLGTATSATTAVISNDVTVTYSENAQSLPLTATVTGTSTVDQGNVTFTVMQGSTVVGAPTISPTVSAGTATVSYSLPAGTPVGTYTIQAVYSDSSGDYVTGSDTSHHLTVTAAAPAITFSVPNHTFGDAPFAVTATSNSSGAFTYSVVSGPATLAGNTVTLTGVGAVTLQATQAAMGNYLGGTQTTSFIVAEGTVTLTFASIPSETYGNKPFTISASSSSSGAIAYSVLSGPASIAGSTVTLTGAGTVTVEASQAATANDAPATAQATFQVAKQASATSVTATASSINPNQSVTLTATVAAAVMGSPTGTVTFADGGTPLGSAVALSNGTAQLTLNSLAPGQHSITASYSGDTNFLSSSGALASSITVAPLTFTVTASPASQAGSPGATFTYQLTLSPSFGAYPGPVTFAASGLPAGATATFSPSTLNANAGQQTVAVTVATTASSADVKFPLDHRRLPPIDWALLLIPLAGVRRMRRYGRRLGNSVCLLFITAAVLAAAASLSGCGSSTSRGTGTGTSPESYTINLTATSGSEQQSSVVTLTLQ